MKDNKKIDDRTVKGYAKDLSRVVILDAKTERELFIHYKKTGDLHARNRLVESGLRFVIKLAQGYARDLEHHKQLISAGNEGLLVAIDRFDVSKNVRFLSYSTWWVLLYIREDIHRSAVVTVPMWRKKSLRKVNAAKQKVWDRHGRDPTPREMRRLTGLSAQQLEGLAQEQFEVMPLENDVHLSTRQDIEAETVNKGGDRLAGYLISLLPLREAFVLRAYFGYVSDPPLSLKAIAAILNISSERVRQIKMGALEQLRRYLDHLNIASLDDIYE